VLDTDKWALASFLFFKIFKHPNFEIKNGDFPIVQISQNFAGRLFETWGTTFLFGQPSEFQGLQVINSGINSNLNLP
jgi:hypothetical protein